MPKKSKSIEVSAKKPLLGGQSQMDKEIEKWTNLGWELTSTTPTQKSNHYLLQFEYTPSQAEKRSGRTGCLVAALFGIAIGFYACFSVQTPPSTSPKSTAKASAVSQVVTPRPNTQPTATVDSK